MGYSTVLLDKALEEKKKAQEELRLQMLEKLNHALDALNRELPFREAYLFGSIKEPFRFTEGSDIDVGFIGLRDEHFFKAMSFLSSELQTDVDIVQLRE